MKFILAAMILIVAVPSMAAKIPTIEQAIASKTDLWGEMSMRLPNGPTYEFFRDLLPPLRYVDAPFVHYPIVLSPPCSKVKARFISNGSAVNALARQINWRSETGIPVTFYLGEYGSVFGADLHDLDGPRYEKGYLPIVQNEYRRGDAVAAQEVFCSTDPAYADNGLVFVRFTGKGKLIAQISLTVDAAMTGVDGVVRDSGGNAIAWYDENWKWTPGAQRLVAVLTPDEPAHLAVFTKTTTNQLPKLDAGVYDAHRAGCIETWESVLGKGVQIETPESVVNDAWRSLVVGTLELMNGDEVHYSMGNQYAKMYVGEGGDTIRALALFGQTEVARRLLVPLMDYKRDDLLFHQAGKKLQLLSHYYWLTRDESWFDEQKDRVMLQVNRLVNGREPELGLAPREAYCGDIKTPVYSFNSNANGWGGLVEFSAVLAEMGNDAEARRLAQSAGAWKPKILDAVEKSVRKDVDPPFVPVAMFGEEQPYDPLTATRLGGYWDLMAPYMLGSGFFPYDSAEVKWITDYLERKGGLMMGMVRVRPDSDFYVANQNLDDLYTLRYTVNLLQRDEVDRALVSFYGKLAQGFTRDTFIGAEGSCPTPLDEFGRQFYLPPNSASNAFFLSMLRNVMVQDWDMDGDARPETLRLMYATPRRWLEDGRTIRIERAPTAFGEVSVVMTSHLNKGEVTADVTASEESPKKMLLRARLPKGWKVKSASVGGKSLTVDATGSADITGMTGRFRVEFRASVR